MTIDDLMKLPHYAPENGGFMPNSYMHDPNAPEMNSEAYFDALHERVHTPVIQWHEGVLESFDIRELPEEIMMAMHCLAVDIFVLNVNREPSGNEQDTQHIGLFKNIIVAGYLLSRDTSRGKLIFNGHETESPDGDEI